MNLVLTKTRALMLAGMLALIAGIGTQTASAAVLVVGTCTNGVHFNTINAALATNPPAGSTIRICPGTYPEQVVVTENLTLSGFEDTTHGTDAAVITVPATNPMPSNATSIVNSNPIAANLAIVGTVGNPITVNLNNLIVDGLGNGYSCPSKDATNVVGILYQNASGTANHVTARNQLSNTAVGGCQGGFGILVEGSGLSNAVTIENSTVHDYNKNGIVGNNATLNVLASFVTGAGPTSAIAQNGIEYVNGATGKVSSNHVTGDRYTGAGAASTGILLFGAASAAPGSQIIGNDVDQADLGIALYNDGTPQGPDNGYSVVSNTIGHSTYEGIDVCSGGHVINTNKIYDSGESGIDLEVTDCTSTGNSLAADTIVEACAGVLGTISGNTFSTAQKLVYFEDTYVQLAGTSCPPAAMAMVARASTTGSKASGHRAPKP